MCSGIRLQNPSWKRTEINGLWVCPDFLSPHQQSRLLSQIQKEGWFTQSSSNQAMGFGDHPGWAVELSSSICEVILLSNLSDIAASEDDKDVRLFPSELLWREPLFDQLIVNKYEPGSLVLMWGEARYLWEHGIDRSPGFQMWEGQEIEQKWRISVTLRRLHQNSTP